MGVPFARAKVGDRYVLETLARARLGSAAARIRDTCCASTATPPATRSSPRCRCSPRSWHRQDPGRIHARARAAAPGAGEREARGQGRPAVGPGARRRSPRPKRTSPAAAACCCARRARSRWCASWSRARTAPTSRSSPIPSPRPSAKVPSFPRRRESSPIARRCPDPRLRGDDGVAKGAQEW